MLRRKVAAVLEPSVRARGGLNWLDVTVIVCIVISSGIFAVLTMDGLDGGWRRALEAIDGLILMAFALEYGARMWSCTAVAGYEHPVRGRLRFATRWAMIVDFVAILPLLIPVLGANFAAVRLLRVLRIARVARLGRYSRSLQLLGRVVRSRIADLSAIGTILVLLLFVASTLIYFAERSAQPESFGSIPASLWWSVATLTTVGYGDVYPITTLGRMLAGLLAILGIGFVALPTGVLSAAYLDELRLEREARGGMGDSSGGGGA